MAKPMSYLNQVQANAVWGSFRHLAVKEEKQLWQIIPLPTVIKNQQKYTLFYSASIGIVQSSGFNWRFLSPEITSDKMLLGR